MANALKCDRCGSFYTPYFLDIEHSLVPNANSRVSANCVSICRKLRNNNVTDHYELDLCHACMEYILSQIFVNKFRYDGHSDTEKG